MAIYYMGDLISGEPKHQENKTIWRNIGDRVLFVKDYSQSTSLIVNFA